MYFKKYEDDNTSKTDSDTNVSIDVWKLCLW